MIVTEEKFNCLKGENGLFTGNGFEFRRAEACDLPRVLELFSGAVALMRRQGIDQWDELYPDEEVLASDIRNRKMYLLILGGEPVSAVVLNTEQDPEYRNVAWQFREAPAAVVHRLCVKASEQGKGIATATLALAEKTLLQNGFRNIRLDAFPQNPGAIRLYEGHGYRRAGQVYFRKGLFYCYEKLLQEGAD